MSKKNFGAGDFDHVHQRAARALSLVRVLRAAMQHDEDNGDLGGHSDDVLEIIERELSDIVDVSEEAGRTLESQAVAS